MKSKYSYMLNMRLLHTALVLDGAWAQQFPLIYKFLHQLRETESLKKTFDEDNTPDFYVYSCILHRASEACWRRVQPLELVSFD